MFQDSQKHSYFVNLSIHISQHVLLVGLCEVLFPFSHNFNLPPIVLSSDFSLIPLIHCAD